VEDSGVNVADTSIYGVVRDESGRPLSGATVYIVAGTGSWLDIAALTNERGEYKLSGMNPGSYAVSAHHENFISTSVNVEIREAPSRVDVTLKRK
jgi:protocatechuate 3,4-dioxygenase beta subunit